MYVCMYVYLKLILEGATVYTTSRLELFYPKHNNPNFLGKKLGGGMFHCFRKWKALFCCVFWLSRNE